MSDGIIFKFFMDSSGETPLLQSCYFDEMHFENNSGNDDEAKSKERHVHNLVLSVEMASQHIYLYG